MHGGMDMECTTASVCAACHESCCVGKCDNGGSSKWMYELVGDMRML